MASLRTIAERLRHEPTLLAAVISEGGEHIVVANDPAKHLVAFSMLGLALAKLIAYHPGQMPPELEEIILKLEKLVTATRGDPIPVTHD